MVSRLIVLRGNSAAGKSTVSQLVREKVGPGLAVIEQDHVRRTVLSEQDRTDSVNIGLIDTMARFCLDSGFDVLIEGILDSDRYGTMLRQLTQDHRGIAGHYYLDVPLAVTLVRHKTRAKATEFDATKMQSWYRPRDVLPGLAQKVIDQTLTAEEIAQMIFEDLGSPDGRSRPATAI